MHKRNFLSAMVSVGLAAMTGMTHAQENTFKVGLILPMSGPFASTGKQLESAARLYMAQHGDTVAGRKVVLVVKDDTGSAEVTKRHCPRIGGERQSAGLSRFWVDTLGHGDGTSGHPI